MKANPQKEEIPNGGIRIRHFGDNYKKLEKDIAWWINGSKSEVRMGITIDIKRRSG